MKGPWWPGDASYTLGATNPFFLDVDGDGRSKNPHEIAQAVLDALPAGKEALAAAIAGLDDGAALQLISLLLDDAARRPLLTAWLDGGGAGRERLTAALRRWLTAPR